MIPRKYIICLSDFDDTKWIKYTLDLKKPTETIQKFNVKKLHRPYLRGIFKRLLRYQLTNAYSSTITFKFRNALVCWFFPHGSTKHIPASFWILHKK